MLLKEAATDWLASKNIFYNVKTNQISDNINDLIEPGNIGLHPEGLRNYLEHGFSAYGQTPITNIKFLPPNSKIWLDENNLLQIEELPDPFEKTLGNKSTVKDAEEYFHFVLNEWGGRDERTIIIPTSGGFDSRFIDSMIERKELVHAYTYGISERQEESMEVVYAKKLCEILGISWKQIELGEYNAMIDDWYQLYGVATHAHGMYQMEFYDKIRSIEGNVCRLISGIYGDVWAGNWRIPEIDCERQLSSLTVTHGLNAEPEFCKLREEHELRHQFFERNKDKLKDENWRVIFAARMKIILISYLLRIPELYGFESWSPFLDFGVVSRIINLDWKEKERRKWQVEYFRKKEILIGELKLPCDYTNCLNQISVLKCCPKRLDTKLLGMVMDESYVEQINNNLPNMTENKLKYYSRYLVLYPIQRLLQLKEYGEIYD